MKTVAKSLPQAGTTLEKCSYCVTFRNVYLIPTQVLCLCISVCFMDIQGIFCFYKRSFLQKTVAGLFFVLKMYSSRKNNRCRKEGVFFHQKEFLAKMPLT